jgi:hypothetical protein
MRPSAPTVAAQLPVAWTVKHENQMAGGDHRPPHLIVIGPLVYLTTMKRIACDARVAEQGLVSFLEYDLGYFDKERDRVEPGPSPFMPDKVLTM